MTTRTRLGLAATAAWVLGGILMLVWKRASLVQMSLNEWGDYLGGFVAPIAFLWLILGYFQQGEELQQNTDALRLQQEELRRQVEETAALVKHAELQTVTSAELLALERQQITELRKREKERIQPTLLFASGSGSSGRWDMKFRNQGGPATDLKIETYPACDAVIRPSDYLPSNSEGAIVTNGPGSFPTAVTIRYTDQGGEPGICRLEINSPGTFRPARPATQ